MAQLYKEDIMDALFIYMNKIGDVKVEELEGARKLEDDQLWEHIATIEPKTYLRDMLNKNAKIVADLLVHNA